MNKLIPNYSFIKLFLPYAKNYNNNITYFTDICFISYRDKFKYLNNNILTNIIIKEQYEDDYNIDFFTKFTYNNFLIKENINIEYDRYTYKINYKLNDDIINIKKFKVENNNLQLLLEHYKFINDKYILIYNDIKNNKKNY